MTSRYPLNLDPQHHYLLCTHRDPDPDGTGALLALWSSGLQEGYRMSALLGDYPPYMDWMPGLSNISKMSASHLPDTYHLLALDCGQLSRIWPASVVSGAACLINMDHHTDNDFFGHHNFIDTTVSSTCELLFRLMNHFQMKRNQDINENLMAGILFDSGGLRYPNTSRSTLAVVSQLIEEGVSLAYVAERIFSRWTAQSYQALQLALKYTEFPLGDPFLLSWIPYAEIAQAKLNELDFEGVVQVLREHHQAKIIALIRETQPGFFKGSLRSKDTLTVHDLAHHFNGGGHALAAGFSTRDISAQELRQQLLSAVLSKIR